jgi:hypothetical protein
VRLCPCETHREMMSLWHDNSGRDWSDAFISKTVPGSTGSYKRQGRIWEASEVAWSCQQFNFRLLAQNCIHFYYFKPHESIILWCSSSRKLMSIHLKVVLYIHLLIAYYVPGNSLSNLRVLPH